MYLSLEDYRRRMLGCWIGKNVGGTLGMPMEWNRQPNDVTYYTHKMTGEPLPNDDLDIQVLWLLALEDKGLDIDCKVLGQYFNELMIFTHDEQVGGHVPAHFALLVARDLILGGDVVPFDVADPVVQHHLAGFPAV